MTNHLRAKPFIKWAGGKTQLIDEIKKVLPKELVKGKFTYVEPFIGSGAVMFWMIENFPKLEYVVINDLNNDLINTYKVIATNPRELIAILSEIQNEYHELDLKVDSKNLYFYEKRNIYNQRKENLINQAALFIFLNRTCFNGLYRVNKANEYNVPTGRYKKPTICDAKNLMAVSEVLKKVQIFSGDFENTLQSARRDTLFYFDPPYKPLNGTSYFNSYSKDDFNDTSQLRLRDFCTKLDVLGYQWILSNSDVKGNDINNNFFDDLYFNFNIKRIEAKRTINANPEKRGLIKELLITNYDYEQTLQPA